MISKRQIATHNAEHCDKPEDLSLLSTCISTNEKLQGEVLQTVTYHHDMLYVRYITLLIQSLGASACVSRTPGAGKFTLIVLGDIWRVLCSGW